jgi:hypothetical protein
MRVRDLDLPYPIVLDPGLRIAQRYTSTARQKSVTR